MILKKFDVNTVGRDFVIGDLHGCYDLLMQKLDDVSFNKEIDRLFSVGDLVDRGPDSYKCLSLVFEPWFHTVKGNHEELMESAIVDLDDTAYRMWMANGGLWALDHLDDLSFRETIEAFIDRTSLAISIETKALTTVGIVHAEPPYLWSRDNIRDSRIQILWSRRRIDRRNTEPVEGIDAVFVGHTPVDEVTTLGNVTYIDTGCNWTGNLTMIEIK